MKHAPGPWRFVDSQKITCTVFDAEGQLIIARCATPEDARLIALAPEMLSVIEEIRDGLIGSQQWGLLAKLESILKRSAPPVEYPEIHEAVTYLDNPDRDPNVRLQFRDSLSRKGSK